MTQEAKETDEDLLKRLKHLYDTWPRDGWDGAAAVIARHADKARAIEQELKARHEAQGQHGSEHPYYTGQCACRGAKFPQ